MTTSHKILAVFAAGCVMAAPGLYGQTLQKPSSYSGVSQPPPDDTITSDAPDTQPQKTPALVTRPQVASASTAAASAAEASTAPVARKANCDSEERMVGDPDPCLLPSAGTTPAASVAAAPVSSRQGTDFDMVSSVPTRLGELPEGSILKITVDQEIASGSSQVGADFSGHVSADVTSLDGKVVIPQGAQVLGKIVQVTEGHRFGSPATVRLRPDVVVLPDGARYVLRAQVLETDTKLRVDSEGSLKPASRVKTNVIKETAGIGVGAATGAVLGGGPGALVGSIIGAGVMTTNILVQHPAEVNIPRNTLLTLSLTQPMTISPEMASNTPGGSN
jgi:hypothetical protein